MRTSTRLLALLPLVLWACGGEGLTGLKNQPPVADAGHDLSSHVGEGIRFDGSKSTDADGEVVAYAWSFGDGAKASGKVVTHSFSTAGAYQVTLTVTDDQGAQGSASIEATITKPDAPPVAIIQVSTNSAETGTQISFDASASTDDGTIVGWAWEFGDGQTASTEKATHAYQNAGAYLVRLTVTDDAGLTGEDDGSTTIRVQAPPPPPPAAIFPSTYSYEAVSSTSSCQGGFVADPLQFTIPNPTAASSSCTIKEGDGVFLGATYQGTYTSATRSFSATAASSALSPSQTLAGTFASDFKSFDGTYSGGSCSSQVDVHGTRTNPP